MSLFVRITAIAAAVIVALIVLKFVLGVLFFAAVVAAIVVGVLAIANHLRRRRHGAMTLTVRR